MTTIVSRCRLSAAVGGLAVSLLDGGNAFAQDRWTLVPDVKYAADTAALLTEVQHFAVDGRGSSYVVDIREDAILMYDTAGIYQATIGRRGWGPGEFRIIGTIGLHQDMLWAWDQALQRITFFDPAGRLIRETPTPQIVDARANRRYRIHSLLIDGSFLMTEAVDFTTYTRLAASGYPLLKLSPDGEALDTLGQLAIRNALMLIETPRGGLVQVRQPWHHSDILAVSRAGDRIVLVERPAATSTRDGRYRIKVMDGKASVLFDRTINDEALPLTDAHVEQWLSAFTPGLVRSGTFPSASSARSAVREHLYVPEFPPAIPNSGRGLSNTGAVLAGLDGMIWILRTSDSTGQQWDVVDPVGVRVASIRSPAGVIVSEVSREFAWGVELDPDDVPWLVRYRIRRLRR